MASTKGGAVAFHGLSCCGKISSLNFVFKADLLTLRYTNRQKETKYCSDNFLKMYSYRVGADFKCCDDSFFF